MDYSIHKWRFIQYRKRYEFLKENYADIADIAKTAVLNNAVLYYAFDWKSFPAEDRKNLYRYICSRDFSNGITSRSLALARIAFRFLPRTVSSVIKRRIMSKTNSDATM